MRIELLILLLLAMQRPAAGQDSALVTRPETGIAGQVYCTGATAIPADWTPPPLRLITPLILLDSLQDSMRTILTSDSGKFKILLPPGKYFFIVKESMIPRPEGVFSVTKDSLLLIKLYYDNGVR
jgi:hypothetical protein